MIKHYLKVSFRNLWKYKSFSAINILGLAIGMATCLLILQYVSFKLSYDQFHKNADNIYRVVMIVTSKEGLFNMGLSPIQLLVKQ